MLKRLPVLILLLLFFTAAEAQSTADSLARHAPADSISQKLPADSTAKPASVDSAAKHPLTDAVKHLPADSVAKQLRADSAAKHPKTDSVAPHHAAEGAAKHKPVKAAAKHPVETEVIKHSPIKTLSDLRYNAYLKGEDLDSMAIAGELNHYPLPDHALKYKVQIGLNPGQITKLKDLAAALHRKKVEMGDNIIRNEKMLDSLFHSKQIVDGTLIFYTNRSGLYYGELRGAILMTCYETEKILSDDQIRKLEALEKDK